MSGGNVANGIGVTPNCVAANKMKNNNNMAGKHSLSSVFV